ncbi:MAG TPA: RQC domain-containing protein, partial [Syntrophobacteraceae bacterium]|nr:RQC domain-containing protein [Syntrophobacteraceae bacterium]
VAQKALSCVYRTGQRFGAAYLTDVLLGKEDERIRRFGHDKVSTFGIGTELSEGEWKSVFRQLVAAGLLSVDIEGKGGFRLASPSRPVLRGEHRFELRKDPVPAKSKKTSRPKPERGSVPSDSISGELWEQLRSLRLEIAREQAIAPFLVFHDTTLKEMVKHLPRSLEEMRGISGVGQKKLELYGDRFLSIIRKHGEGTALPDIETGSDAVKRGNCCQGTGEVESTSTRANSQQQKAEVIRLLKEGKLSSGEIAERVGISPPTVWAYKAHLTIGTYGDDKESKTGRNADHESAGATGVHDFHSDAPIDQFQEGDIPLADLRELIINKPLKMPTDSITDQRLLEIRKKYRRAYEPWSNEEDEWLLRSHKEKQSNAALAKTLERQPSAIRSRIRKFTG